MKKKNGLRLVLILTLALLFTCSAAMAASAASPAARIGKKKYKTVQAAISAVKSGQKIVLLRNVTEKPTYNQLSLDKNCKYTLDLNKHTLKVWHSYTKDYSGEVVVSAGNVTITNGKIESPFNAGAYTGTKKVTVTTKNVVFTHRIRIWEKGYLTMQKGSFKSGKPSEVRGLENHGRLVINGTKFTFNRKPSSGVYVDSQFKNSGVVTIKNAEMTKTLSTTCYLMENYGKMTIEKGKFDGEILSYGTLTIKNGTFKVTKTYKSSSRQNTAEAVIRGSGKLSISGGKYYVPKPGIHSKYGRNIIYYSDYDGYRTDGSKQHSVKITGGTFNGAIETENVPISISKATVNGNYDNAHQFAVLALYSSVNVKGGKYIGYAYYSAKDSTCIDGKSRSVSGASVTTLKDE